MIIEGFVDDRFPEDISYGAVGGPVFSTDIVVSKSGYEQRNINWSNSLSAYNVTHGVKTEEQMDRLISFFRARRGKAVGFRFKDWTDYKIANQKLKRAHEIEPIYQLYKRYGDDISGYDRAITKPVRGTIRINVQINGENVEEHLSDEYLDQEHIIDYSNGLIRLEFMADQDVTFYADCEFDVPVRFDVDSLEASLDGEDNLTWKNIKLVEIRV